jgi:hypothetical protein
MNSQFRSQPYVNHDDIILFSGNINEFFEKSSLKGICHNILTIFLIDLN